TKQFAMHDSKRKDAQFWKNLHHMIQDQITMVTWLAQNLTDHHQMNHHAINYKVPPNSELEHTATNLKVAGSIPTPLHINWAKMAVDKRELQSEGQSTTNLQNMFIKVPLTRSTIPGAASLSDQRDPKAQVDPLLQLSDPAHMVDERWVFQERSPIEAASERPFPDVHGLAPTPGSSATNPTHLRVPECPNQGD
ncbi:hypothetical protein L0F63_004289, partial [Massospora cicadina]